MFFIKKDYCGFGDPTDSELRGEAPTPTTFVKTLSARKFPKRFFPGQAQYFLGDMMSGVTGIKSSCIISMSLIFFDQQSEKTKFTSKRNWVVQQTSGPLIKWVPSLINLREGFDLLSEKLITTTQFAKPNLRYQSSLTQKMACYALLRKLQVI